MIGDSYVRIQLDHDYLPQSNPYPDELEAALRDLNLPFIGWTKTNGQEAIIRHETGPEIVLLATSLATFGTALVKLFMTWKKTRPETTIQVRVSSAKELEKVLNTLKNS
jgi:hypothetical protein